MGIIEQLDENTAVGRLIHLAFYWPRLTPMQCSELSSLVKAGWHHKALARLKGKPKSKLNTSEQEVLHKLETGIPQN
jgi:hypothetical protein